MSKPKLTLWQLSNMSFGFLGIQFGWGLQMTNTSAIFEYLGAGAHQIPILWLAAPLTGLIVQPVIGNLSDNTWGPLGRRRPYFLIGAIFASIALIIMPNSPSLWIAVGSLWLLDTAANISMEPFRAFVGDLVPPEQRTKAFAMQSVFVGVGAIVASALPWVLNQWFIPINAESETIPFSVTLSFYIGSAVFLSSVLWTVFTTKEYPPKDMAAFERQQERRLGVGSTFREIGTALREMPLTMRQLAWTQCFSWLGMYCLFLYFPPAIARNVFGAVNEHSALYAEGIAWAGICMAVYNAVCVAASFLLPQMARLTSRKVTHAMCLGAGAVGTLSIGLVHDRYLLLLSMVGVGIAWASLLSMPYAILVGSLPLKKGGIYMGIFNSFIVLPEVLASLGLGWVMSNVFHDNRLSAVMLGGVCFGIGALLALRVSDPGLQARPQQSEAAAIAVSQALQETGAES